MKNKYYGQAIAIVGLQYGSEGKGAVAEYLSPITSASVRVGAANAGHTVYYQGKPYVMRMIPCSWVNPATKLIIGISALISLDVLLEEIECIEKILPIKKRIFIDKKAHVITAGQQARESGTGLAERISSTSAKSNLGIGIAMADKVLRSSNCVRAEQLLELQPYLCDTVELLNNELDQDQIVVFEGTQGFGLSIDHGHFPYTTSRDTTAQSLFAGTGVNPYPFDVSVIGVARAYPIRVGGPSGIFDADSHELDWNEVKIRSGSSRDITEKTSVTKSIRRVATFSLTGFKRACAINRVSEVALTFADHIDASVYEQNRLTQPVLNFIKTLEAISNVEVSLVKTGPTTMCDFNYYRSHILRKIS